MSDNARIIGLLSFYDENPQWLRDAITTYARCGITHYVCVDGAYFLLQDGKAASPRKQHKAIIDTCANLGVGLTLHVPETVWMENEVEKRTFMFQLADTIKTSDNDWVCVIDADEAVEQPVDLRRELAGITQNVAELTLVDRYSQDDPVIKANPGMPLECQQPIRKLFRARGIHCAGNHFTYVDGDGNILWCHQISGLAEAHEIPTLRVLHRSRERNLARHRQQYAYYQTRDKLNAEVKHGPKCNYCDEPATTTMDGNLQSHGDYATSDRIPTCAKHAQRVKWETFADITYSGNPGNVSVGQAAAAFHGGGADRFIPR